MEPLRALRSEGVIVDIVSIDEGPLQAMHLRGITRLIPVDRVLRDTVRAEQYDSLVIPGGALSVDALRANDWAKAFLIAMDEAEKPIGALSHAAWLLISTGIASQRRIASIPTLRDDLLNAGAIWAEGLDCAYALSGHLLTSSGGDCLADFDTQLIELISHRTALISPETRQMLSRSRIA